MVKSSAIPQVPPDDIRVEDPPEIAWIRVSDAINLLWSGNPKLHHIGAIVQSIEKYGFQELPKFDETLYAIKAGNGRIEALSWMEGSGDYDLPRGLASEVETGRWVLPVLIGTDARSKTMALAYAVDSNNIVTAGVYTPAEIARMWDFEAYTQLVEQLARQDTLPVTVTPDDLGVLRSVLDNDPPTLDQLTDEYGDGNDESEFWPYIRIAVTKKTLIRYNELWSLTGQELEQDAMRKILDAVDVGVLQDG